MKNLLMKNNFYKNLVQARSTLALQIKNKAGIYQLVNLINNKTYIGSSNNLYSRLSSYLSHARLKRDIISYNSRIGRALLKYGYKNFGFTILEFIELDINLTKTEKRKAIFAREQHYLDTIKPEYNILKIAGSHLGYVHTRKPKKLMIKNSRVRTILYVYNEAGSKLKIYNSISELAAVNNINRLVIAKKLKKSELKPVLLLNRDNTNTFIISYTPLNKSELDKFRISIKNKLAHNIKQPHSKKVFVYYLDGKSYASSPFDNLAQVKKEFKMAEATINKYAELRTPYKKYNLIFSFTPIQFNC
jgi:group I intron endonuclease